MADENNQNNTQGEDDFVIEPTAAEKKAKTKVGQGVDTNDEADAVTFEHDESAGDDVSYDEKNPLDAIRKLKEKLKIVTKEKQEYLDGWQRMRADFTNARKREEESRKEIVKFSNEDLIMQIMPVLDSFTMAFSNKEAWERIDKNWRIGVEHIYSQLLGVLQQNGFSEFSPMGETFDPMKQIAIESVIVTDKNLDHKVVEVPQKGYMLNGKIVRPASVKIGEYKAS